MAGIKETQPRQFRLHYYVSNNGDGSASTHFYQTEAEAEAEDENQPERWGESSCGCLDLAVNLEGQICFVKHQWNKKTKKNDVVLLPLNETP